MTVVHLSLGSNIGDRLGNIRRALAALAPDVGVEKISSVYETAPQGVAAQPAFLNIAVEAQTSLAAPELLARLQQIERELGRKAGTHDQPRELDIDIILYGDLVHTAPELTVPHPRMHERPFVLVPLDEIAPFAMHPLFNVPVIDLRDQFGDCSSLVWLFNEQL